ncbi:hypothetical protein GCM10007962_24690 [Yeosuana aromativorans]|uniref:Uncharacterized protein n=1 Tax=Yeosuana aromativorans TaxID=288019 RepID=A0A8J3BPS7_9FLAO|nr:hypothetical protein GCM10007962_24690 [Yeosuana aromativorans]
MDVYMFVAFFIGIRQLWSWGLKYSILHNINYSTNVYLSKKANTSVFDIISDITSCERIISTDIMSQPFYVFYKYTR